MAKLTWDDIGKKIVEAGASKAVLFVQDDAGIYPNGVVWNGLTKVSENPSGAEANPQYADNIKYANILSTEEYGCTIEAFTYPDEFAACDGSGELTEGVTVGQQPRKKFGFCYRTEIGNDVQELAYGYKIHLVYGCSASPSQKEYNTINNSPEGITFSWEVTTTPVPVTGFKPTASVTIDSTKCDPAKLAAFEEIIYGSEESEPRMPLPDEVKTLLAKAAG